MIYLWGNTRRINAASNYNKKTFGERIQKVTIDAGFTCPNRDGSISTGGCTFCNNDAFNPSYCIPNKSITQQISEGIRFHAKRYKNATKFLAYFQAYSNTYKSVTELKKIYSEALNSEGVIGLIIGTRPDCVNEEIFDLLEEINKNYLLTVEFGIESVYDKTLEIINRGHNYAKSVWAINEAHKRGIKTGGHIIFGLPGEDYSMMMKSAAIISQLPLHTVKFHQLQYVSGTKLGEEYAANPQNFKLFEVDEYVNFISEYLGYLSPNFIIERLAGETQPDKNLATKWDLRYDQVLQKIEKKMEEKDIWQGKFYEKQ
jgi:radical SAM protein (TIGR01212 family)